MDKMFYYTYKKPFTNVLQSDRRRNINKLLCSKLFEELQTTLKNLKNTTIYFIKESF